MLLTKEVEIVPSGSNIKYYRDLEYDAKYHVPLIVKVEDLTNGSHALVDVLCDICNKPIKNVIYKSYNRVVSNTGSYVCTECAKIKREHTCIKKYNVKNPMQLESIREKSKRTCIERYGVDSPLKNDAIKDKIKQTNLQKYGCSNAIFNPEVNKKKQETNIKKYGSISPFGSIDVQKKSQETMLYRYGVYNATSNPKIREKQVQTLYKNSSQKVSTQQVYLHSLYGGELNYPISHFNADICFTEEKITIEYNGGGHMLNVITGRETQEEYNQKELIRDKIIRKAGFKQITIISSKDFLPSDSILLKILNEAREYFNSTNHAWVEYNIDLSTMRNAEYKDGIPYDFGELRKIKKVS